MPGLWSREGGELIVNVRELKQALEALEADAQVVVAVGVLDPVDLSHHVEEAFASEVKAGPSGRDIFTHEPYKTVVISGEQVAIA